MTEIPNLSFLSIFLNCLTFSQVTSQLVFTNPILDRNSADPAVIFIGNHYYLTLSENTEHDLTIYKSPKLTDFRNAESKILYSAGVDGYSDLWASEAHIIDDELLVYFAMRNEISGHRMFAIKAENPQNPMGNWSRPIRLMPELDSHAIDGSPFLNHGNGQRYFLFAGGSGELQIAPMINGTTIGSPKVVLKRPTEEWECHGTCINEAPYMLYRNNRSFCVISVCSTWDPNYSLAYMSIDGDKDPMVPSNWVFPEGPIFYRNDDEGVYATGHAGFTLSPDGTETWMTYHGSSNLSHVEWNRFTRIEKTDWTSDRTVSQFFQDLMVRLIPSLFQVGRLNKCYENINAYYQLIKIQIS